MSPVEEFALLMRALSLYGLDDLNFTHCSAQTPEMAERGQIMITSRTEVPFWAYAAHNVAFAPGATVAEPNGHWLLHQKLHEGLGPRGAVILHTHSIVAIAATASQAGPIEPISQNSLQFGPDFLGLVGYKSLEAAEAEAEAATYLSVLGETRMALLIEGHGTLTLGRSFGEAFEIAYNLERALRIGMFAGPNALSIGDEEAQRARDAWKGGGRLLGQGSWPALRRYLAFALMSPIQRTCN